MSKKGNDMSMRCSICGRLMKFCSHDTRDIPFAVRNKPPRLCSECVEELMDEKEDLRVAFFDSIEERKSSNTQTSSNKSSHQVSKKLEPKQEKVTTIDYKWLMTELKKVVRGQDKQVEQLCLAITLKDKFPGMKSRTNILMVGDTGTGKSLLIREVAKAVNKVVTYEDATTYTEEGYVGDSVRDMLKHLLDNANGNLEKAQNGIVFIDEGDKKGGAQDNTGRAVSGVKVLESMLTMLDGSKIAIPKRGASYYVDTGDVIFDTSNLIFVFSGSFSGLKEIRAKRLGTKSIGFANVEANPKQIKRTGYIPEDFVMFGIPREFVGRCSLFIEMNSLTSLDYFDILKNSENSVMKEEIKKMESIGIELVVPDEVYMEMAEFAEGFGSGGRALAFVARSIMEPIWANILKGDCVIGRCELHAGITQSPDKYTFY